MYACLCRAVPEQRVREAVASGVSTISGIRDTCGAGTGCGGCLPSLRRLLRECLATDLTCSASAVLESGMGMALEPICSLHCAEAPEPGVPPSCAAGLGDRRSLADADADAPVARL